MVRERAERNGETPPGRSRSSLSVAELRQLISLMDNSDLEEITIEHAAHDLRLTLRKPAPQVVAAASAFAEAEAYEAEEPAPAEETANEHRVEVRASLVGIYRAAVGKSQQALSVGDIVKPGQAVANIEALNVLNEVEAETGGRVAEILVTDGQAVEYGQPLLVLEPLPN